MLDYLKYLIQSLNNSKLFAGLIMLLMNIGSKYITIKFSKSQEAYIRNKLGRQLLILAITFIATKDKKNDRLCGEVCTACYFKQISAVGPIQ